MATNFTTLSLPVDALVSQIESGQLALPELQRPFVWARTQVRDLVDSMYRGYPTGYFLLWQASADQAATPIGIGDKAATPSLLVVDGQQRLTSLYAVFRGAPVLTSKFVAEKIRIAFNPLRERFQVANNAIDHDPEWIADISQMLSGAITSYSLINAYLETLKSDREITSELAERLAERLQRLESLKGYTFNAIQLTHSLPVEEVSEIFVRVNSKGTQLNQSDFILTLMSVYWDKGRTLLEDFCRTAKIPSKTASPFNWFLEPTPDQLLRVAIGLGHRRAVLRYAYELLRGKDLETGVVTSAARTKNFEVLKIAQEEVLDLTNFTEFLKALQEAGFRSGNMITSRNSIVYCYLIFLIGRRDYDIDYKTLRSSLSRWFLMCVLTSRYTGSAETQVEKDIRRLGEAASGAEFVQTLDQIIHAQLTTDFWSVTLPDQLAYSGGYVPAMFAYFAALDLLGGKVLFSTLTVHQLLDPSQHGKKSSIERHHLFPRGYLKTLGITASSQVNQVANYALVEWPVNLAISDAAPSAYFPEVFAKYIPESDRDAARFWHALPVGWEAMTYPEFLAQRRKLMAKVIEAGFNKLSNGIDPEATAVQNTLPPLAELVAAGESETVEFKSSLFHSQNPAVPSKVISGSVVKTIAAFRNTSGGSLVIGVADDGTVLGLTPDFDLKGYPGVDSFENGLRSVLTTSIDQLAAASCKTVFETTDDAVVCIVHVEAATKPTYASTDKGSHLFFIRSGNTTQQLETKEAVSYIAERWGTS